MNQTILFAHPDHREIENFLRVCREPGYEVLTADNGEDALRLIADRSIAIAVISRRLKGDEGSRLLDTLQKEHPYTLIILGAYRLTKGDLYYFLNRRKVYRIYLEPVDYREELLPVLEQALLDREVMDANREDLKAQEKRLLLGRLEKLLLDGFDGREADLTRRIMKRFQDCCEKPVAYLSEQKAHLTEEFDKTSALGFTINFDRTASVALEEAKEEHRRILFSFLTGELLDLVKCSAGDGAGSVVLNAANSPEGVTITLDAKYRPEDGMDPKNKDLFFRVYNAVTREMAGVSYFRNGKMGDLCLLEASLRI